MSTRERSLIWAVMIAIAVCALIGLGAVNRHEDQTIDPARIRKACEQYAPLDLSGWASICRDAGYQETSLNDPEPWPIVSRPVMPEDLDQ